MPVLNQPVQDANGRRGMIIDTTEGAFRVVWYDTDTHKFYPDEAWGVDVFARVAEPEPEPEEEEEEETWTLGVYRVVLAFKDHDELGADGIREMFEHTRYPNHIIGPDVIEIDCRMVEDYNDEHDLNYTTKFVATFKALFEET